MIAKSISLPSTSARVVSSSSPSAVVAVTSNASFSISCSICLVDRGVSMDRPFLYEVKIQMDPHSIDEYDISGNLVHDKQIDLDRCKYPLHQIHVLPFETTSNHREKFFRKVIDGHES